ncbi:hypothetical protein BJ165DRAFT_397175 [Panaeolus papilionaceus]|nr:hypothetical protein BJ165DRAFT_397175 [Panaeolus papilionaceus]
MKEISVKAGYILQVCMTFVHAGAILLTIFRIYHRKKTRHAWWDDYLAGGAAIMDLLAVTILWLSDMGANSVLQSYTGNMIRYGIGVFCVIAVEWLTRISLALAFARIFPPGDSTRRYAIGLAVFFFCLWSSFIIQAIFLCSHVSSWAFFSVIQCCFSKPLIYYYVVSNVVADVLLVISPLYKLRHIRLPDKERRLIFVCIAGSLLMSCACVATSVFQLAPVTWEPTRGVMRIFMGYLEAAVSLIVCNLLVIATYCYTMLGLHNPRVTPMPEPSMRAVTTCTQTRGNQQQRMATTRTTRRSTVMPRANESQRTSLEERSSCDITSLVLTEISTALGSDFDDAYDDDVHSMSSENEKE